jgi:hypothetical protein
LSSKEREIESLKDHFLNGTIDDSVRIEILDALEQFGNDGMDAIDHLIADISIANPKIKHHGLETIRKSRK